MCIRDRYSSVFVASTILLWLGVKRDWSKSDDGGGTQFGGTNSGGGGILGGANAVD